MLVDGRGHGNDVQVAAQQVCYLATEPQMAGRLQFCRLGLTRNVVAGLELGQAVLVDIKAHHAAQFAKRHRQRQANVAQANNGDFEVV